MSQSPNVLLDLTKPIITRMRCPVRILCTDRAGKDYPIVALVTGENGVEYVETYTLSGQRQIGAENATDLLNTPPSAWVNIYRNSPGTGAGSTLYTREAADAQSPAIKRCALLEIPHTGRPTLHFDE